MQNFQRMLNPISVVRFAGFESTTYALQCAGWQLSMEQDQARNSMRLALKHEGSRLYALSRPLDYEFMYEFHRAARGGMPAPIAFDIMWIGSKASFQIFPHMGRMNFKSVSAEPEFVSSKELRFEDAIPFRPLNMDAPEIIVPQHSIPELMDMILKLQDPKQKEIREKKRKEAWREQYASDLPGYNPAADIKAQIISLAG